MNPANESREPTSSAYAPAPSPIASAAPAAASPSRSPRQTRAPRAASSSAVARPIPRAAPVTATTACSRSIFAGAIGLAAYIHHPGQHLGRASGHFNDRWGPRCKRARVLHKVENRGWRSNPGHISTPGMLMCTEGRRPTRFVTFCMSACIKWKIAGGEAILAT
jgi:hypothetical protein